MTQVINHNLGYKIVYNPGLDFDLGYKNKSEFFYYPCFESVTCVGYAIYFDNLDQNLNLGYEQFYNLGYDLWPVSSIIQGYGIN